MIPFLFLLAQTFVGEEVSDPIKTPGVAQAAINVQQAQLEQVLITQKLEMLKLQWEETIKRAQIAEKKEKCRVTLVPKLEWVCEKPEKK